MDTRFKPIKKLITVSLSLHIVSLCLAMIVSSLQVPLFTGNAGFAYLHDFLPIPIPSTSIMLTLFNFILHCGLTVGFWKALSCENTRFEHLRILYVISFVYILFVFPFLASYFLDNLLFRYSVYPITNSFAAWFQLRTFFFYAL